MKNSKRMKGSYQLSAVSSQLDSIIATPSGEGVVAGVTAISTPLQPGASKEIFARLRWWQAQVRGDMPRRPRSIVGDAVPDPPVPPAAGSSHAVLPASRVPGEGEVLPPRLATSRPPRPDSVRLPATVAGEATPRRGLQSVLSRFLPRARLVRGQQRWPPVRRRDRGPCPAGPTPPGPVLHQSAPGSTGYDLVLRATESPHLRPSGLRAVNRAAASVRAGQQ